MEVRREQGDDFAAIDAINTAAFEREGEARLVRALRELPGAISLVAVDEEGTIVGHIAFSRVTVDGRKFAAPPLGLGPMSVLPERQNQGIGTDLVRAGLEQCRAAGAPFVVVLGHPDYYPRFGFVPASRYGLRCEWDVPDEVFLAQPLVEGALADAGGLVRYARQFATTL